MGCLKFEFWDGSGGELRCFVKFWFCLNIYGNESEKRISKRLRLVPKLRQHCRLSFCSYFGWVWLILNLIRAGLSTKTVQITSFSNLQQNIVTILYVHLKMVLGWSKSLLVKLLLLNSHSGGPCGLKLSTGSLRLFISQWGRHCCLHTSFLAISWRSRTGSSISFHIFGKYILSLIWD